MANQQIDKTNLGYIGEDFQYKLVKVFVEEPKFFEDSVSIIEPNAFTAPYLRDFVGTMKDYFQQNNGLVPSYEVMGMLLKTKAHTDIDIQACDAIINKLRNKVSYEGIDVVKDTAIKFFKQQNLIKVANKIQEIAKSGDLDRYAECQKMLEEATMVGQEEDFGFNVYEMIDKALANDYTVSIPTGISKLDEVLGGGLDKGKIGLLIAPAGFGKAQPLYSKIVTPDGIKTMGEMKIGDKVFGRDGKAYSVSGVYPQGMRPVWKLTFENGRECECDEEHLWTVYGQEKTPITVTTKQLLSMGIKKYRIPRSEAVEYPHMDVEHDAYKYGKQVGIDGINIRNTRIAIEYLYNDIETRKKVFNGIVEAANDTYFSGTKPQSYGVVDMLSMDLKRDFITLALSLGYEAQTIGERQVMYTVEPSKFIPFEKAEYAGKRECQCIMVDSEEHLYLTEDFIVTHNTSFTTAIDAFAATYRCELNGFKGYKVLQIYFEDDDVDITRKIISKELRVQNPESRTEARELKRLNDVDREDIKELLMRHPDRELLTENLRLKHFKTGVKSATDIGIFIKKLINSGFKPDLVTIDYFECLAPEKGGFQNESEWSREGKTMRILENIAHEFNIAIWVPTQGTKDSMNSPDFVRMDQASGSAKKVHVAQLILSVGRQLDDIDKCRANIAILKNRSGKSGKGFKGIYFDNGTCTISCDEALEIDGKLEWDREIEEQKSQERRQTIQNLLAADRERQAKQAEYEHHEPDEFSNCAGFLDENGEPVF